MRKPALEVTLPCFSLILGFLPFGGNFEETLAKVRKWFRTKRIKTTTTTKEGRKVWFFL